MLADKTLEIEIGKGTIFNFKNFLIIPKSIQIISNHLHFMCFLVTMWLTNLKTLILCMYICIHTFNVTLKKKDKFLVQRTNKIHIILHQGQVDRQDPVELYITSSETANASLYLFTIDLDLCRQLDHTIEMGTYVPHLPNWIIVTRTKVIDAL